MSGSITGNYDADTFYLDDRADSVRIRELGSPERQLKTKVDGEEIQEENLAGTVTTQKSKVLVPEGSKVRTENESTGPFGRTVADLYVKKGDQEIDYSLMAMDQKLGRYETRYRTDERVSDDAIRIFQATETPYKIGAVDKGLSDEEFQTVHDLRMNIADLTHRLSQEPSPEGQAMLDNMLGELYGRQKDKLLSYHFMRHPSAKQQEDGSWKMEHDTITEYADVLAYNSVMSARGEVAFGDKYEPEVEGGFGALVSAYNNKYGDFSNLIRWTEASNANNYAELDYYVPIEEKLQGIKPEDQALVLQQTTDRGALKIRDQLLNAYKRDAVIDRAGFLESLGAGAIAFGTNPSTWVGGGLAVKGIAVTAHTGRTLAIKALGTQKATQFLAGRSPQYIKTMNAWVTGSSVASATAYAPSLAGDPTTTLRSYTLDVAADTAFGAAFGGGAILNKAIAHTGLGKKLNLMNEGLAQKYHDASQAFYDRMVMQRDNALSELDKYKADHVTGNKHVSKAESETEFWDRLADADAIAQEEIDSAAAIFQEEMGTALRELHPDLDTVDLPDIAAKLQDEYAARAPEVRNAILKEMKEQGFMPKDTYKDEVKQLFTPEVLAQLNDKQRKEAAKLLAIDLDTIESPAATRIRQFVESGEAAAHVEALKAPTVTGMLGQTLGYITRDMATHLRTNKNPAMQFLGAKVTELGRGLSGAFNREGTGGLIKQREFDLLQTKVMPGYEEAINSFAINKGHSQFQRLRAMEEGADINPLIEEFGKQVQLYINSKRMGTKYVPHDSVVKFVDNNWSQYTSDAHGLLVRSGISGFHEGNKLDHYMPRIYRKDKIEAAIETHGLETVTRAIAKGLKAAHTKPDEPSLSMDKWMKHAKERLNIIRGLDDIADDQFMPSVEGSAKHRFEMDLSAKEGEFSLVDILENDVAQISEKYSHRASGLAGFAQSTGGLINSDIAWDSFKKEARKGSNLKSLARDEQMMEDLYNMMMGKPTQGGLPSWARSMRDMAVVTQMGNLGLNEIMEAGVTAARSVMQIARDPKMTAAAYNAARGGKRTKELMDDVVSISGLTDAMEKLERHGSHLDVRNAATSKVAHTLDTAAHYMTGGNLLPTAKRLLAKTTGFNMARRAKYRLAQMSMLQDLAKYYKDGSSLTNKARLRDLGLDSDDLRAVFNDPTKVTYGNNGLVSRINVDALSQAEKDLLGNGLYRAASQDVQKHIVGELPPYLNNPMWTAMLQYLSFPLVATNKQLARNAQFADMEALTGVMLNLVITGLVQEAMIQTGLRREEDFTENTYKYYSSLGILPDVSLLAMGETELSLNRIPMYSLMESYAHTFEEAGDAITTAGEDPLTYNDVRRLVYMNNHATFRAMVNVFQGEVGRKEAERVQNKEAALRLQAQQTPDVIE